MITVVDYGMGNLHSLCKALDYLGFYSMVTEDPMVVENAEKIILPGVGAFGMAMDRLNEKGMTEAIRAAASKGTSVLGICLGMQLLFSSSSEYGCTEGLGLIDGEIGLLKCADKIPHMGWNTLETRIKTPLLEGADGGWVYFVHSYCAPDADAAYAAGVTDYGGRFCSVAVRDNVYGTQFHPEKSGETGLRILANFAAMR